MICSHLLRSSAKLVLVVAVDALARALAQHHERAARRAGPALLRRRDQHVDARRRHVDPHRARGDAIEHEQPADLVRRLGDRAQVVVGQDDSRRGLDVRREHHVGPLVADRAPPPRRSAPARTAPARPSPLRRALARSRGRDAARLEDLRPAVAEPAVADAPARACRGELARDRLPSRTCRRPGTTHRRCAP